MNTHERRRLEQLAFASLTEADCPDADRLAAYILGALTGNDQLVVAAHVRDCPLCRHDIAICRPPDPRPRSVIAQFSPFALADGRRGAVPEANVRRYVAADLTVELTIAPPIGENWRITGQIMRSAMPVAQHLVTLRARRRRFEQTSDDQGFFTFESVPAGHYTLTLTEGPVQVQIRSIALSLDQA